MPLWILYTMCPSTRIFYCWWGKTKFSCGSNIYVENCGSTNVRLYTWWFQRCQVKVNTLFSCNIGCVAIHAKDAHTCYLHLVVILDFEPFFFVVHYWYVTIHAKVAETHYLPASNISRWKLCWRRRYLVISFGNFLTNFLFMSSRLYQVRLISIWTLLFRESLRVSWYKK